MLDLNLDDLELRLEQHRGELTVHCSRMLGSRFEAEDAVQETLVRAWRSFDGFEGRSSLRGWLYRIATNVCLNHIRCRQRHAAPADLSFVDSQSGLRWERTGIEPAVDPADHAVSRDAIRLAFIVALGQLPPRQRAVLILREVLRWQATEVAELLDTSVAAVNSSLQRARATLAAYDSAGGDPFELEDHARKTLLARYVDAFERCDVDTLVALVSADGRGSSFGRVQHTPSFEPAEASC